MITYPTITATGKRMYTAVQGAKGATMPTRARAIRLVLTMLKQSNYGSDSTAWHPNYSLTHHV